MTAPATVPEVIARMREIEASAAPSDGVASFARLYLQVTEGVRSELGGQVFGDPRFLDRLDVVFANLFFTALESYEQNPAGTPAAWAPLFAARARKGIAPLQFALAGMNAHINRDLPVALVTTCGELSMHLSAASPEHEDFELVNTLLGKIEQQIKASYLTGWLAAADRILHRIDRIDDVLAMWDIRRARDAAWANGETLWALRAETTLRSDFLATLDRMVGFAGRGLLFPADTLPRRIGRFFARDLF